jgi:hypothetical protein
MTTSTNKAESARSTFKSLPKEIQQWWVALPANLKDPIKFSDWASLSIDQWIAVYEIYCGRYKRITLCGPAGSGKEMPISEPVLTPNGWSTMGQLHIGSKVIGSNGISTQVLAIYPQGVKDVYTITFNDGSKVRCGLEHLWTVKTKKGSYKTLLLSEMLNTYKVNKPKSPYVYQLPVFNGIQEGVNKSDAYALGYMLGNGCFSHGQLAVSCNVNVKDELSELLRGSLTSPTNIHMTSENGCQLMYSWNSIEHELRDYRNAGLSGDKQLLPKDNWLTWNYDSRLDLLKGLLDSDGTLGNGNADGRQRNSFYSTSVSLINLVRDLIRSLGGRCCEPSYYNRAKQYKSNYGASIHFRMPVCPFKLKANLWKEAKFSMAVKIVDIVKETYQEESVCITVEAEDSLYVTTGFKLTHNTYTSKLAQRLLEESNKEVLMVASTGIAAYLSGGITINSAFSMGADQDILPMGLTDKIHHSVKPVRKVLGKTEYQIQLRKSIESVVRKVQANGLINKDSKRELVIFFDEVGMFSSENMNVALQIVKQHFAFTKRPVRFVFLADYRQLLPVHKPSETPWTVYSNLAIHDAKFETLRFVSNASGVSYVTDQHVLQSPLGVVKTATGLATNNALCLSLITNHRQGEDKAFINDLNSIGDGTGSFTSGAPNYAPTIASRIFLKEGNEVYNWLAAKKRQNVTVDPTVLEKATHVYHSNRAVSERNSVGTAQAINKLKQQHGQGYVNFTRDYGVTITVAKGETADSDRRVIQDISPVGVTTLSVKDPSYAHEKATHVGVPSNINNGIHTFAYQRVCVGMRWMCRMNLNPKLRNGTVCTVTFVSDKYFNVVIDNDDSKEHIRIEAETELFVKKNGKGIPIAKVYGVPGHPAYALTFHKTQGITVPEGNNFVLHIDSAMIKYANDGGLHGLFYVGCSRVETLEQLYIMYEANVPVEHGMNNMCKTNESVFEFISYTEDSMHQYICKEYVHTYGKQEIIAKPVIEQNDIEDPNLLREVAPPARPTTTSTVKRPSLNEFLGS